MQPSAEALHQETEVSNGANNAEPGSNSRVQYVTNKVNEHGERSEKAGKRTYYPVSKPKEDCDIAFVIKDYQDKYGDTERTEIVLKGQDLRNIMYGVLRRQLEHDQNRNWLQQEQTINAPAHVELWYWSELSIAARSNQCNEQGRQDLQMLLDHLSDMYLEDVKLVTSIATMSRICTKDLWCLFRPGTLVVAKPFQDEPQLFQVHDSRFTGWSKEKTFVVDVWAFSWTGSELIQEYYTFETRKWEKHNEEMLITDLPCYPIAYYKDKIGHYGFDAVDDLKTKLLERGKAFRGLCRDSVQGRPHTYQGELLADTEKDSWLRSMALSDRDFYSGLRSTWMWRFAEKTANDDLTAENGNYLLLPARVLGYCFNLKAWAQFHVEKVGTTEAPDLEQMMAKLIFPEEFASVKEDLQILIEQHGRTVPPSITDPIKGKGAGLVVLFHGPPGVGKTLTAETLAKCAGKPLYVAGASDIGLDPKTAEATLRRLFELAERWGAVLLIDEADVFLDSRGTKGEGDMLKNALVSTMLRVLEYFKGILIMTTNRVMTFDIAMLSRCNYTVNLKFLTLKQEKAIWQGYVDQLNEQNSSGKSEIELYIDLITKRVTGLSGREIRNVFTTAQTLAQAETNKKVEKKHLERVYDRLQTFLEEMRDNKNTQYGLLNAGTKR
ncbi:MAG: hypothetical protein Q9220_005986 [cf. Caloplaca sp. 1 TL-2023]